MARDPIGASFLPIYLTFDSLEPLVIPGVGDSQKYLELQFNMSRNLSLKVPPVSNLVMCILQDPIVTAERVFLIIDKADCGD